MAVNVGHLHKKRTLRRWGSNEILDLQDEADGGWIIRKGQIVNQVKFDELVQKELDRQKAKEAPAQMAQSNVAPEVRNAQGGKVAPEASRMDALESKVGDIEGDIKKILNLLQK